MSAAGSKEATRYRSYLLAVLTVVLAFTFLERFALGVVLQDLKAEFELNDTQLGALGGIAFALFYSVMGIPIARWADRGNRVTIISITLALWSVAVALCGAAASFIQLLLVRVGVAVGEAGCVPPAHSLLAQYFDRAERPRAIAIYMLGPALSVTVGYFVAGWLNEIYGWRMTFVLLGLPGLVLAALTHITLREPRRVGLPASTPSPSVALAEVVPVLWTNVTFRHLLFCFCASSFFAYGILQWQPAFFARHYGLESGALGTWFALICGPAGLLGTYVGGQLAVSWAANNEALQLRVMAFIYGGFGIASTLVYIASNQYLAFAFLAVATFAGATVNGPLFATLQTVVPDRMRATSVAILYLFANLVGMGLGPLAAGALSDAFEPWLGEESLRYALLALCPGYVWGGCHLWQASKSVESDAARGFG
jgi:predicted MFS family arabinose efflux permease